MVCRAGGSRIGRPRRAKATAGANRLLKGCPKIVSSVVRQLRNPAVHFVGLSIGLHMSLLWLAYAGFGTTLLTTPMSMVIMLSAMQAASLGPSIRERTGSFRQAAGLAIGVPLGIAAMGVPVAVVIERTTTGPMTQSALLTPWWFLYFGLMFRHTRNNGAWRRGSPVQAPGWVLAIALIPVLLGFALAVFALQLVYLCNMS